MQLLGGLTKYQETKTKTGIPGLASIPILGKLFSGESVDRERQELMIALIPHIVRRPEYTAENLRGIAVGNQQSVHLNYGRQAGIRSAPAAAPKKDEPAGGNPPVRRQPGRNPPVAAPSRRLPLRRRPPLRPRPLRHWRRPPPLRR